MRASSVVVIVPVYNSVRSLPLIVEKVSDALRGLVPWHIIFVDDRSPNADCWPHLVRLTDLEGVSAVRLLKNRGRAAAVFCGLHHACAVDPDAVVVIMDDDLQHDPLDIKRMLSSFDADTEADVVVAQFREKEHHPLARAGSWLKSRIDRYYYGLPSDVKLSSFVALSPQVAASLSRMDSSFPLFGVQLLKVAGRFRGLDCVHSRRYDGSPSFTFTKRLALFFKIVFSDTIMVLRLFAYLGMSIAVISIICGFYFIIHKLISNETLLGWTSLLVTTTFLGGLNMFLCGLIGINMIRTKENVERVPAWSEREIRGRLALARSTDLPADALYAGSSEID